MLVVSSSENSKKKIEILNLLNPGIKQDYLDMDEHISRYGTIGIPFQNKFLICGGLEWNVYKNYRRDDSMLDISKEVIVLGEPSKTFEIIGSRISASYVVLNHNQIWITGGISMDQDYEKSTTTEFISCDENSGKFVAIAGPKLPFRIFHHCMITKMAKSHLITVYILILV